MVGHHAPVPTALGAGPGAAGVDDADAGARSAGGPAEIPHPAAHGCCHVAVTFLPAAEAEPVAAPAPRVPRPPRSTPAAAGLLAFGIYRPPSIA